MKNLLTRTMTGVFLLLTLAVIILSNRLSLFLLVLVISSIGLFEFYFALKKNASTATVFFAQFVNLLIQWTAFRDFPGGMLIIIGLSILVCFTIYTFDPRLMIDDLAISVLSIVYISMLFSFLLMFPQQNLLFIIFISGWGTDTFAYVTGMLIGKHPLAPSISPKKTVEGSVGGTLGAVLLAVLVRPHIFSDITVGHVVIAVLVGSIMSQIGDLFASRLKREVGVKDYGTILLGHGGILDRFDSILFAAPAIWLVLTFL